MTKIIACIDGSKYSNNVCNLSSWVAENTNLSVSLLHVASPHYEVAAKGDLSGSIGLSSKNELLKELTKADEEHGKEEQRKGEEMLKKANENLISKKVKKIEILHRRGSLVETIVELESEAMIIVMGKRGENTDKASTCLSSNLESVARSVGKPLLVATDIEGSIKSFVIAYDGSESAKKAVEYSINNSLLKNLECHILKVSEPTNEAQECLREAEEKLKKAGFKVNSSLKQGSVEEEVLSYIKTNNIDLLVMGSYGHSKILNLILGSTTAALINKSKIPVLLLR